MKRIVLLAVTLLISFHSYSQTAAEADTTTYGYIRIDSTLQGEIEGEISKWTEEHKDSTFQGGLMDMEIFSNDSEVFSTYKKDKVQFFFPFTDETEKDSIIQIVGSTGTPTEGYGFHIYIRNMECIVVFQVRKDGNLIFKNTKKGKTYMSYALTKTQYHLTLTKMPSFKKGEIIEGLVELRGYPYYEKGVKGDDKKSVNIIANFKTPPIQ